MGRSNTLCNNVLVLPIDKENLFNFRGSERQSLILILELTYS